MQPPLHNQDCPLCGRSARYFFVPGSDGSRKEFSCPHCREFSITRDAENRIGARPMLAALCSDLARDTPEAMLLHVRLRLIIVGAQTKMEIVGDYERRGQ